MVIELIIGAVVCGAGGAVGTLFVVRHKVAAAAEDRELAAIDRARADERNAVATRTAAATEQVMHRIARDLATIEWRAADQTRVNIQQHDYYRQLLGWHEHLRTVEARLVPVGPVLSVADVDRQIRDQFDAVTGGSFADLPVLGAPSVYDRLGRSTVVYAPADPELLADPEQETGHHVSAAIPDDLRAVLDKAEGGPVWHEEFVTALTGATDEQPIVDPVEPVEDPAEVEQGPAPTAPTAPDERMTGGRRDWMGPAARRHMTPAPNPVVIGQRVRELMRQHDEAQIAVRLAEIELPILVGAGA